MVEQMRDALPYRALPAGALPAGALPVRTRYVRMAWGLGMALALALGIALGVAGCGNNVQFAATTAAPDGSLPPGSSNLGGAPSGGPGGSAASTPAPGGATTPTPQPTPMLVPAPLTGRLVSPEAAARHPIAVMIDDLWAARPQSGFSAASIVWQAPAEGGIPRYMMIFGENQPGAVGPVRSARYYYIAWAAEWRAVYAHAGGSPQALETLRAQGGGQLVYNADQFAYGGFFRRVTDRFAPHNLYTDGAQLEAIANSVGAAGTPVQPIWRFAPGVPLAGRPAGGRIIVSYPSSTIEYDYDRATNSYPRTVSTEGPERDAATGARVAPQNVVIMLMQFGPLNDGHPGKGRLEATVVGRGIAWICTNGRTTKGTWRKASLTAPTQFYDGRGVPITLTVGQTFVNVLPLGSIVRITPGGSLSPARAL